MGKTHIMTEELINENEHYKNVTGTTVDTKRAIDTYNRNPSTDPINTISTATIENPSQTKDWESIAALESVVCAINDLTNELIEQKELLGNKGLVVDGTGKRYRAKVTQRGQLVTAPLDFSTITSKILLLPTVVYNLVPPSSGEQFVVTDIIIYGDKNIGPNDATLDIYEAEGPSTALVAGEESIALEIVKQTTLPITGLNILISEGKWLNAVTNDNIIFINIAGYYIAAGE